MFRRALLPQLRAALDDTPIVFLHGARQTGKTTLVQALIDGAMSAEPFRARYLTLDEITVREAALADPEGFLRGLETPVVLDEVQLVPDLFRALKLVVDRDRRPGRFLLTGSAHLLVLPRLAEALVGRLEVLTLQPLSQGEIDGRVHSSIDHLFSGAPLLTGELPSDRNDLIARIVRGGFPEPVQRTQPSRRRAWFDAYLTTLLQRDVREISNVDGLVALPTLLRLLATRATGLLNAAELARTSGLPRTTLKRYLALLEGVFLYQPLPAWSTNLGKRLVRSPKVTLLDSGLLCHLLGLGAEALASDPQKLGPVLEHFVLGEVRKQATWSDTQPRLYHYRTHGGHEIDLILEDTAGRIVALEVKARASVTRKDFRAMTALQEQLGDRFVRGVVLYTGTKALPFGEGLHALPVGWLWSARSLLELRGTVEPSSRPEDFEAVRGVVREWVGRRQNLATSST